MNVILSFNKKSIDLSSPKIMGVINVTPDSFYDGGRLKNDSDLLQLTEKHLNEGAEILDIGAYSSKPGAKEISIDTELRRLIPQVELINKHFPEANISVDTFRKTVAEKAIESGVILINDISGGTLDYQMHEYIGSNNIPYVLMHLRGTPETMSTHTNYENLTVEIYDDLKKKLTTVQKFGAKQIIIDLGYGFSKTTEQNFALLKKSSKFLDLGFPLLTGISRKSMIYKTLEITPNNSLNGTSILNTVALLNGSKLLRVHDVKEAKEAIILTQELQKVDTTNQNRFPEF